MNKWNLSIGDRVNILEGKKILKTSMVFKTTSTCATVDGRKYYRHNGLALKHNSTRRIEPVNESS